jgi:hypothetical protein
MFMIPYLFISLLWISEEFKFDSSMKTPKVRRGISKFEKARERLYLSWTPDLLPCREGEFQEIYLHLESLLQEGSGSCTCMIYPFYGRPRV